MNKIKNGDKVKKGNTTYTILNTKTRQVAYTKTTSKSTKIKIADAIKINGVKYTVTKISDDAFKNNKKIKEIVIGKNISIIGKNAFKGCDKLKTMTITSKVKVIGANAFSGDKKLTALTITSNKLTGKGVRNSLKGSYIKTIKLSGAAIKFEKKYNIYFKKSNSGKSIKIKK